MDFAAMNTRLTRRLSVLAALLGLGVCGLSLWRIGAGLGWVTLALAGFSAFLHFGPKSGSGSDWASATEIDAGDGE